MATIPSYFTTNPTVWFIQLESYFALQETKEDNKYHVLVSRLPEEIAVRILDEKTNTYKKLKDKLLQDNVETQHERVQTALVDLQLDGRKPSKCVEETRRKFRTAELDASENIIKSRLLSAMPMELQPTLVAHLDADIDRFTAIAHAIITVKPTAQYVNQVQNYPKQNNNIQRKIQSDNKFTSRPKVCRFHVQFGRDARNCTPWCHWPDKASLRIYSRESAVNTPRTSRDPSPNKWNNNKGDKSVNYQP